MKNKVNSRRAFSLVELLVALSILAVVAAIIVPRFLNVREEAVEVTANAQIKELNNVYKKWAVLGGRVTNNSVSAVHMVSFLGRDGNSADTTRGMTGVAVRDSTSSFGSYTVGLSIGSVPATGIAAAAVTPASPDGFINSDGTAYSGTAIGAGLVYKQGNYVYPISFSGATTSSADTGSFSLGTKIVL